MYSNEKKILGEIIRLLIQFLRGEPNVSLNISKLNPTIFHYYTEIIRYWNKLNFAIQTTLISLKQSKKSPNKEDPQQEDQVLLMATYLYSTYRVLWESATLDRIMNELSIILGASDQQSNLNRLLSRLQTFNWDRALKGKTRIEHLSLEESVPTFVIQRLLPVMSHEFLRENLHFMNGVMNQPDCTVRINTFGDEDNELNTIFRIQQDLEQKGILLRQDPDIPELFHVPTKKRALLLQSKWYQLGHLIFQDKASAAVVNILSPQPYEDICDLCAAPGIKTSFIANYTFNTASIIAIDVHLGRIRQMKKLLIPLQASNIQIINSDGYHLPIQSEHMFDRILLDAPCTGSGTLLTNPILKWRQNQKFLEQNRFLQSKLLESALQILKPHGILVYSTCSLYPEEGELQILKYLNTLKPLPLPDWLASSYTIVDKPLAGAGRLFPAHHQTQGFFISKFEKKG